MHRVILSIVHGCLCVVIELFLLCFTYFLDADCYSFVSLPELYENLRKVCGIILTLESNLVRDWLPYV